MANNTLLNPDLEVILDGWKGNFFSNNTFASYNPNLNYGDFSSILKWQFGEKPQKAEKKADQWKATVHDFSFQALNNGPDQIVWMGHACFLIRMGGKNILIDPVFYDLPFITRNSKLPAPPQTFTGLDYILVSHDHRDHCDQQSLTLLAQQNPGVEILTTLKLGETLLKSWIPGVNYQEAGWYQQYHTSDGLEIYLLPASHWCKRGLFDLNNRLWGSFIIRYGGKTIYFGADSGYETHFNGIGQLFPNIDYAMLGIGAYKPEFIMKNSHTSPQEAVQAFHDLRAKTMIPMHYGTFDLSDEPFGEPWRTITGMAEAGEIEGELKALEVGKPMKIETEVTR